MDTKEDDVLFYYVWRLNPYDNAIEITEFKHRDADSRQHRLLERTVIKAYLDGKVDQSRLRSPGERFLRELGRS